MPPPLFRRIIVTDRLREDIAAELRRARPDLEVRALDRSDLVPGALDQADAYLGFGPPPCGYGGVRWVHSLGAGVDALLDQPVPAGIILTRSLEDFGTPLREYCLSRALAWMQHVLPYAMDQADRRWTPREPVRLFGRTVVIVGTGRIGRAIAGGFAGLGAHLRGVSRRGQVVAPFLSVSPLDQLALALRGADVLILAAPLTPSSRHLLDRRALSVCQGAFLINVGRGALVDTEALVEALDRGRLAGAALDVFDPEPLPASSSLWDRPDVMISPHVGGLSTGAGAAGAFLEALAAIESGAVAPGLVDPATGY